MQVQLSKVRDSVHKKYLVQQSLVFRKVLPWLPWKCYLRAQIERDEYPPCIHMDLKYDDPSIRLNVDTTLKISGSLPSNCMCFTVNIPGE